MLVLSPVIRLVGRCLLLLPLLALTPLLPDAEAAPAPSLRFKKLGPLGGDEPSMLSLLQDRKGYVWVGTHTNGLYRYNGYQAVKYINNPNDEHSLPHDRVSAIYEDQQGRIWAGTQNGLARFNPESNNFTVFAPPAAAKPPKNHRIIKNIISDGKNGMWVGSWGGLQHFDPYPFTFLTLVVSLEAIFLSTFVMIGQNRQAAVQQAKADHDFVAQELELKTNTQLTREIHTLTEELHRRLVTEGA